MEQNTGTVSNGMRWIDWQYVDRSDDKLVLPDFCSLTLDLEQFIARVDAKIEAERVEGEKAKATVEKMGLKLDGGMLSRRKERMTTKRADEKLGDIFSSDDRRTSEEIVSAAAFLEDQCG